jgi:uncharacterized membrane protein YfcA
MDSIEKTKQSYWHSGGAVLDFFDLVTEVIDMRSFSNLWYWIVLAVMWSSLSHWVLGIPYHMVQRARRGHADSQRDLLVLVEINTRRIQEFGAISGVFFVGGAGFVISSLLVLGWGYGVEFAQAIVLLLLPFLAVTGLNVLTAHRVQNVEIDQLYRRMRHHRLIVQLMGIISIFITAFWGMYTNVTVSPLH